MRSFRHKIVAYCMYVTMLTILSLFLGVSTAASQDNEKEGDQVLEISDELSLEQVLEKGLQNHRLLTLLAHTSALVDSQIVGITKDLEELNKEVVISGGTLPVELEEFEQALPDLSDYTEEEIEAIYQAIYTQIQINQTLNAVLDEQANAQRQLLADQRTEQRKQLYDQIHHIGISQNQSRLEELEAKERVSFFLTTAYTQLLSLQEQVKANKASVEWMQKRVEAMQIHHRLGLASPQDIARLEKELRVGLEEVYNLERKYDRELSLLCLGLNLQCDPNLRLQEIRPSSIVNLSLPANVNDLITSSYLYLQSQENVQLAKQKEAQVISEHSHVKKQYELQRKIAEAELELAMDELHQKIIHHYADLENAYYALISAKQHWQDFEEEDSYQRLKYELGLQSLHQYEAFQQRVEQARLEMYLAELTYYVKKEAISSIKKGYIP